LAAISLVLPFLTRRRARDGPAAQLFRRRTNQLSTSEAGVTVSVASEQERMCALQPRKREVTPWRQ
jgi:hypothetical protein